MAPAKARENLIMDRELKNLQFQIKAVGEDGSFEGLASTYGSPPDAYGDVIEKGAFAKTLEDHKGEILILWQHDTKEPIGRGELEDTSEGLAIKGKLELDLATAQKAYIALRTKLVKGLSIGFRTIRKKTEKGIRKLLEIKLYEVSLVTFPANENALVTGVKSAMAEAVDEMKVSSKVWGTWGVFDSIVMRTMFDREMTTEDKTDLIAETIDEFKVMFITALPDYFKLRNLSSDSADEEDRTAIQKRIEIYESLLMAVGTEKSAATPEGAAEPESINAFHSEQLEQFRDALLEGVRS
jgi:HK97 family phage prohead protease